MWPLNLKAWTDECKAKKRKKVQKEKEVNCRPVAGRKVERRSVKGPRYIVSPVKYPPYSGLP